MGIVRGQKQKGEKLLSVLSVFCSLGIIILVVLQISGIWKNAMNVFEPLLGVLMLIQTIQNWKKNKTVALVSLCAAILIFGYYIFIFVIR